MQFYPGDLIEPTNGWNVLNVDSVWMLGTAAHIAIVISVMQDCDGVFAFFPEYRRFATVGTERLGLVLRP